MHRFADLLPATRAIWAKSGEPHGHGLLAHMLDVAAVAEAIVRRESGHTQAWAAQSLGLPSESAPRWLAGLVGLHDFGKAIPGFQSKWPAGQQRDESTGLSFKPAALTVDRHDLASAVLLRRNLAARISAPEWVMAVSQAVGAHHGYMPTSADIQKAQPRNEGAGWAEARQQLLDTYWGTLELAGEPSLPQVTLPAAAWLAGLTSVADWIGSNQDWFPPGERDDTLTGHFRKARDLAEHALDEIGWPVFRPLLDADADADSLVGRVLGASAAAIEARPLQRIADRLLSQASGPTLMIVEAPMGEGKTELAFLAHLRLQAANGHRGLYVALPTQATGNAMFDRALTFLRSFARDTRLDIQLAHSGAMLDERIHHLRGIDESEKESVSSSAWFSQRKRPLLSPYGAGTIDQALFATLNVKHHFVRLWGLANRVVVLDEVHAYDTYTSGLIEALLRWLKAMHCSVVLMSATLPEKRRAAFLQAWDAADAPEIQYPRVLMTCGSETIGEHSPSRPLASLSVAGIPEDLEALAEAATNALKGDGCGAVIVNTVQRAQDLYTLLKDRAEGETELLLFHARYPADERGEREKAVLAKFGRGDAQHRPPRALLVATQVVEQSLDLDFDFMISDLAPVDLLLQRAGRLHRHERPRPPVHDKPQLIVAGLLRERPPELEETKWGFVYDAYVLYRTWAIAGKEPVWHLPADIDRLVQEVYSYEPFAEEERAEYVKTLDRALGEHLAEIQEHRQRAVNAALDSEAEPQLAYVNKPRGAEDGEGLGLRAVTRLGDDGIAVVPVLESEDGWRLFACDEPFDPGVTPDDALARRIYRRQVRLSRKDIARALTAQPAPTAFDTHPLLRNLKAMTLRDGVTDIGKLRVRLDPELGITYETPVAATEGA
jgi:CRISPR-associated endonuclease/helicase Cas3